MENCYQTPVYRYKLSQFHLMFILGVLTTVSVLRNKSIILLIVGTIGVTLMVATVMETGHQVEAKKAKQYKVRIFVYNAHLVGQEVFVTTLV